MPSCSPFKSSKAEKVNEIEDLRYFLENTLSRTDDILIKHKASTEGSDVQRRQKSTEVLNPNTTYNSIYTNLTEIEDELKKSHEIAQKFKSERDQLKSDYNQLFRDKSELFEKYEKLETELINSRHNDLVSDYQKNPLVKREKIEELEDGYVDLYGTYKRTIRESKEKMDEMRSHYERAAEEQKEKIGELRRQLQNVKSIQEEFAAQIKRMTVEFKDKDEITNEVIRKLQDENEELKAKIKGK